MHSLPCALSLEREREKKALHEERGREGVILQPRSYCPRGIIFVCDGIAKVDEQTVAEILGNVSVVPLDYLRTGLLILSHDLTQFFGIKLD